MLCLILSFPALSQNSSTDLISVPRSTIVNAITKYNDCKLELQYSQEKLFATETKVKLQIEQIEKLHGSNDSILALNVRIKNRIAEIDKDIAKKEAELAKLKKQNAQNTAKLNAMSDADLSSTFTELFN